MKIKNLGSAASYPDVSRAFANGYHAVQISLSSPISENFKAELLDRVMRESNLKLCTITYVNKDGTEIRINNVDSMQDNEVCLGFLFHIDTFM